MNLDDKKIIRGRRAFSPQLGYRHKGKAQAHGFEKANRGFVVCFYGLMGIGAEV